MQTFCYGLGGHRRLHLPLVDATLDTATKKATDLTEFVRVRLTLGAEGLVATPAASQSSGVLTGMAAGAGLLVGPRAESMLAAGRSYPVIVAGADGLARERPASELAS